MYMINDKTINNPAARPILPLMPNRKGAIAATIMTNLLICHFIEPYVLYKNAFTASPAKYYLKNYSMILAFVLSLIVLDFAMQSFENQWIELLVNGSISIIISFLICAIAFLTNKKTFMFLINRTHKDKI